jgi:hypothetical protein
MTARSVYPSWPPARGLVLYERASAGHGLMNPGRLSVAGGNLCREGSGRPLSDVSAAFRIWNDV